MIIVSRLLGREMVAFAIFYIFFSFDDWNKSLSSSRTSKLRSSGKRISSRLDAITAEKEQTVNRRGRERKHGNLITRPNVI